MNYPLVRRSRHPNASRYLFPPTYEQIKSVIEKTGLSEPGFERFFGIPETTIKQVRLGKRKHLPTPYWHLIFENSPQKDKNTAKKKLMPRKKTTKPSARVAELL
jgi:hypothetical protein